MKHLFTLLLPVTASAALQAVAPLPAEVLPVRLLDSRSRNVVFLLSDDHGYDAMSSPGHPFAKTPVVDSMAGKGVFLKNALATTSLCSPSRASILTGGYTFRHRMIDNSRLIPEGIHFFPGYLQKAGYATAFSCKWRRGGGALHDLNSV
jgi:N-acetylglucosamine-6-sulfatase